MVAVEATAQEILDFMKHWTQAVRLCTDGIDVSTRDSMLSNIAWFEAGNRFDDFTFKKHPDAEEWPPPYTEWGM